MAGQGTIGAEILKTCPTWRPCSCRSAAAGSSVGSRQPSSRPVPEVRVIGVEPELASDARASLKSGRLVEFPADQVARTVADGLRVQRLGEAPFEHIDLRRRHHRRNGGRSWKPCAAWRCGSGWSQSRAGP